MNKDISLTELAKAGFKNLSIAKANIQEIESKYSINSSFIIDLCRGQINNDEILTFLIRLENINEDYSIKKIINNQEILKLLRLVAFSDGYSDYFYRNPRKIEEFISQKSKLKTYAEYYDVLRKVFETKKHLLCASDPKNKRDEIIKTIIDELKVEYRLQLAFIADLDISQKMTSRINESFLALSNLADAVINVAYGISKTIIACENLDNEYQTEIEKRTKLSVISLGKLGARELNYVSDVDVIFVYDSTNINENSENKEKLSSADLEKLKEESYIQATKIAQTVMAIIQSNTKEPMLWEIDPNLRPEGKQGPLIRTIESYLNYYQKWAKNWEFQALMKARYLCGDRELAQKFIEEIQPYIWNRNIDKDIIQDARKMRQRVIRNIDSESANRHLKLGKGGLRDIEFGVQLLQLVHGISDEKLRVTSTLKAIEMLSQEGYIARNDSEKLGEYYKEIRVVEHLLQLRDLKRKAILPKISDEKSKNNMAAIAKISGIGESHIDIENWWSKTSSQVSQLHTYIFYHPLLDSIVDTKITNVKTLDAQKTRQRLQALGYRDPDSVIRHCAALISGLSRTAKIHKNLLPVMLQWFSDGSFSDEAILAYRRISEALGRKPWYLKLLRDSKSAASNLAYLLANSKFAADFIEKIPESVAWLERNELLKPTSSVDIAVEFRAVLDRVSQIDETAYAIKAIRRREILRIAMGYLLKINSDQECRRSLSVINENYLRAMFELCSIYFGGSDAHPTLAFIAVGRFGGSELNFASDLDLLAVYDNKNDESAATAHRFVNKFRELCTDNKLSCLLDFDLRPEGSKGPIIRSLESYRKYYNNWANGWEAQALLRARFSVGDEKLGEAFIEMVDNFRYRKVLSNKDLIEMRRLKARMEDERLPKGADPMRHIKLGRGSLSDIEWLIQLYQRRYVAKFPQLKSTETLKTLDSLYKLDLFSENQLKILEDAWNFCSNLRSAIFLVSMVNSDILPNNRETLDALSHLVMGKDHGANELEEKYFSLTRRARVIFEEFFYN